MQTLVWAILCVVLSSCISDSQEDRLKDTLVKTNSNYIDSLEADLELEYQKGHLPGFAVSVFTADSVYLLKGYGFADINKKKPYTENTIQNIASISKTLIAVSLMKAVENGFVTLDDDINTILPFPVTNPMHKNTSITLRHLATHTSSISDDGNYKKAYVFSERLKHEKFPEAWKDHIDIYNENESMPMNKFLKQVFSDWQIEDNFLKEKPGTTYEYSNIGAALLAYCLELKTGTNYKLMTEELILNALNMNDSGWNQEKLNQENQIVYYNEIYNPVPKYTVISYPDGGLFTTVSDLTKYFQDMIRGYEGNGKLLTSESYTTMMKNQIPDLDTAVGIFWDLDVDCCIGHGGNDFGLATLAYFDPDTGVGKILFTNLTIEMEEQEDQFYSIFNTLFAYDLSIKQK
jgi:CubicO group peptidase (beta-lactamase class C family)